MFWQYKQTGYIWEQYDDDYGGGKVRKLLVTFMKGHMILWLGYTPLHRLVITSCSYNGRNLLNSQFSGHSLVYRYNEMFAQPH